MKSLSILFLLFTFYTSFQAQDTLVKSIFFDFNEFVPTEKSYQDISLFIQYVKANPIEVLELNAYGDKIGTPANNIKLARWRLKTISKLFDSTIHIQQYNSYGLTYPTKSIYDFDDSEKWRRVDVIYTFVNPQIKHGASSPDFRTDLEEEKLKKNEKTIKQEESIVKQTFEQQLAKVVNSRVDVPTEKDPQKEKRKLKTPHKSKKKKEAIIKQTRREKLREKRKIEPANSDKIISTVVLNIGFEGNKTRISGGSYSELEKFTKFLRENPNTLVLIRGHVCCKNKYRISKRRAKNVYKELVLRGIDSKRLSYEGFGNTKPLIHPEFSENDRKQNRRVDAVILRRN
jgi:outer membrane protein OmpA-like peptidoglycan-associated protein